MSSTKPRLLVFPGCYPSHTIVMLNAVWPLLEDFTLHLIVHSRKFAIRGIHSAGLPLLPLDNGNLILDVIKDGEFEDDPLPFSFFAGPQMPSTLNTALSNLKSQYGSNAFKAIVIGIMYAPTFDVLKAQGLHLILLCPNAFSFFNMFWRVSPEAALNDMDGVVAVPGLKARNGGPIEILNVDMLEVGTDFVQDIMKGYTKSSLILFGNSCTALEGAARDVPSSWSKVPSFLVGPICPDWFIHAITNESVRKAHIVELEPDQKRCIDFLDKQAPRSTLYITLGGGRYFSPAQLRIIHGILHKYRIPCLFVNLSPLDINEILPGIDEATFLVVKWAPQLDVLVHPATRVFLTHCGWGGTTEAMLAGIPMISMPVFGDQFLDAKWACALGVSFGEASVHRRVLVHPVLSEKSPLWVDEEGKQLEALISTAFTKEDEYENIKAATEEVGARMRTDILDKEGTKWQEVNKMREAVMALCK